MRRAKHRLNFHNFSENTLQSTIVFHCVGMSLKRALSTPAEAHSTRKRSCTTSPAAAAVNGGSSPHEANGGSTSHDLTQHNNQNNDAGTTTNASTALMYLRSLFPSEKFEGRLPPIVLRHQLYSLVKNTALVDSQLSELVKAGDVRLFSTGSNGSPSNTVVVYTDDYRSHILKYSTELAIKRSLIEKFLSAAANKCPEDTITRQQLTLGDDEIMVLVKACILSQIDSNTFSPIIPCLNIFTKSFNLGRKALLTMINKSKYQEILQEDLERRKLPRVARLGVLYHIHDVIGAGLVQCDTTSYGQMLRCL